MVRDGVISDELWTVLEPVMPQDAGRPGRPWNDHRTMLEAIAWRFRTGSPWRDLPDKFGPHQTVWQRHRLWSTDGTYQRMAVAVRERAGLVRQEIDPILSVDSTVVRAHQHAAGARRDSVARDNPQDTGGGIELQEVWDRARGAG